MVVVEDCDVPLLDEELVPELEDVEEPSLDDSETPLDCELEVV